MELTDIARAAGVLHYAPHRPPLEHISPTAAHTRRHPAGPERELPTATEFAVGIAALLVVWVLYVTTWAMFGGAA